MLEILIHQIQDSFKNMKFIISFILILILFVFNALFYSIHYQEKLREYNSFSKANLESLSKAAGSVEGLVFTDYKIMKKPLDSEFINGNKQNAFPNTFAVNVHKINMPKKSGNKYGISGKYYW